LALLYWVRLSLVSPPLVDNEPFSFLIDKRTCLSRFGGIRVDFL